MGDDALNACGVRVPGALLVTPVPADVTCPDCLDLMERRDDGMTESTQQPQVWLTQQQAADRLQVHVRTIERARADGRLPTYAAGTRRALRFRVEDVDALAELQDPTPTGD